MTLNFEWDPEKAASNLNNHRVSFEYAARVFLDLNHDDQEDRRDDYDEERRIAIGHVEERLLVVAYTLRGDTIRLISARKATPHEQREYRKNR